MKYIFCFILIILNLTACKKTNTQPQPSIVEMPPYTETGKHIAAFESSGKVYIAHDYVRDTSGIIGSYNGNTFFYVFQNIHKNQKNIVRILARHVTVPGTYILGISNPDSISYAHYEIWNGSIRDYIFVTNSEYKGVLTINKIDTTNKIIAGRFEFKSQDFYFGDTISVTKGQFDIVYDETNH